ncbi:hypothetical protein CAPTEDRAFT_187136 [Capitella teleta]|uniref:Methyltransferase domain-containing protein n=1 Tax=Capitella teleta TaxID=283909 RepID=R7VAN4_CAPTE|nr:hypothetical protein CAPTEDRAFT_187136 [Capitella teleta]|eukprot:ELU15659.1 hypothetical protein CAPTEDRAFT_187136 [Capitella teleta]
MATYHLGPETPAPFAVLSEGHMRKNVSVPFLSDQLRFSFGESYEARMCELIHKYLELNTDDRLCYIGDPRGTFVPMLQEKFCLVKPVTTVVPGHIHFEEGPTHRMLAIRVASVGAEDYFRREATKETPAVFDKILMHDAMNYFDEHRNTFQNIKKCLAPGGKVLIIHRPGEMMTLPIFKDAQQRICDNDQPYDAFIRDLTATHLEVTWEVECLPVKMDRDRWYAMIQDHFPPQLENVSAFEVNLGLRELSEGVMKYSEGTIEFADRLLFVTGAECDAPFPRIRRHSKLGAESVVPASSKILGRRVKYELEVTPELRSLVRAKERNDLQAPKNNCSLFN